MYYFKSARHLKFYSQLVMYGRHIYGSKIQCIDRQQLSHRIYYKRSNFYRDFLDDCGRQLRRRWWLSPLCQPLSLSHLVTRDITGSCLATGGASISPLAGLDPPHCNKLRPMPPFLTLSGTALSSQLLSCQP
jgi:hypothetical protein